jgi:hypothetical protein
MPVSFATHDMSDCPDVLQPVVTILSSKGCSMFNAFSALILLQNGGVYRLPYLSYVLFTDCL